ncbi:MAG: DNA translocase FtsK [Chitinophagales bacterium]|nr:DNA translocase FtsK [Chitinophagales bacterium]
MAEATNRLKTEAAKDDAVMTETSEKKTPKEPRKKREKKVSGLKALMQDERTPKVFGLIFLLSALYLFVAFVSYLFTWKADQDKVFHFTLSSFFTGNFEVQNYLGRLGAFVSHFFIYEGFGLTSFLFPVAFFAIGLNLLLRKNIFSIGRLLAYSVFALVLLPTTLSFLLHSFAFPFGGVVGNFATSYLTGFLGAVGTGALLVFLVLGYLVIAFNYSFHFKNPLAKKELPASEVATEAEPGYNPPFTIGNEELLTVDDVLNQMKLVEKPLEAETMEENEAEEEMKDEVEFEEEMMEEEPEEEMADMSQELPVTGSASHVKVNGDEIALDIVETPEEELVTEEATVVRENYDPTIDLPNYEYPTLDLLENHGSEKPKVDAEELMRNKDQIVNTLRNYGIEIQSIKATVGPTVTLYEIVPAPGIRISKIKNLEDDIALSLAALGIRIIAPIPGKGTIGIEVPNINKETVAMRTLLASEKFQNAQMDLPVALGKTISNEIFIADLAKMPHLLMAGATGQGKSVGVNSILVSLLYKKHPSQIKFVLIDPKKVELSLYTAIEKHFLAKLPGEAEPIIVDTKKVVNTLKALTIEMDSRYDLLKDAQCRNVKEYNEKFVSRKLNPKNGHRFLPYIILVIDEFADLIMTAGKEIETPIARLAQLARAIGIHLIIATQRPSVNIITGVIKANFPARMAYKVTSKVDSRTILDQGGAEQLIGRGDMLLSMGSDTLRLQSGFVDTPEVERICDFIAEQRGYPEAHMLPEVKDEEHEGGDFFDPNEKDELFEEAAQIIVQYQQGSTSLLQRRLKLGYNRAGRLMDQLEAAGIVGPNQGSKARDVLVKTEMDLEQYLASMREKSGIV